MTKGSYKAAGIDARGTLHYCKHNHLSRESAVKCACGDHERTRIGRWKTRRRYDRVVELDGGRVWEVLHDGYGQPRAGKAVHQGAYIGGRESAIANRQDIGDTAVGNKRVGGKRRHGNPEIEKVKATLREAKSYIKRPTVVTRMRQALHELRDLLVRR